MRQFFLFVFIIVTSQVNCQYHDIDNYEKMEVGKYNYYIKDGNVVIGGQFVDGGDKENSRHCQIKERNEIIQLSPYDISEYGFNDGRTYYSMKIVLNDTVKKVFLFKMLAGKTNLFFYKSEHGSLFYLTGKDSVLRKIPDKGSKDSVSFHDFLVNYMQDCPSAKSGARRVTYSSKGLKRLVNTYNDCKPIYTPRFKYGLVAELEFKKLLIPERTFFESRIREFNFNSEFKVLPGIFVDIPLFASDISLHSELSVFKDIYSYTLTNGLKKLYYVGNATGTNIPVLIRYMLPLLKARPYINIGGSYTYQWNVNSNMLSSNSINETTVNVYLEQYTPKISNHVIGWIVGTGMELPLTNKNSLFMELRYNYYSGLNNMENFNESAFNILLSYNL